MSPANASRILILVAWVFFGVARSTQIKPLTPIKMAESDFDPIKVYNTKSLVA